MERLYWHWRQIKLFLWAFPLPSPSLTPSLTPAGGITWRAWMCSVRCWGAITGLEKATSTCWWSSCHLIPAAFTRPISHSWTTCAWVWPRESIWWWPIPSAIPTLNKASKPASSRFMQRDPRAYLSDILEAAAAIQVATNINGWSLETHLTAGSTTVCGDPWR